MRRRGRVHRSPALWLRQDIVGARDQQATGEGECLTGRTLCDSQRGVSRWIGFSGGGATGRGERGLRRFSVKVVGPMSGWSMGPAWRCAKKRSARFIHILTRHEGSAAETSGQGARGARRTRTVFCFPCTIYTWNNRNNKWKSNCPLVRKNLSANNGLGNHKKV